MKIQLSKQKQLLVQYKYKPTLQEDFVQSRACVDIAAEDDGNVLYLCCTNKVVFYGKFYFHSFGYRKDRLIIYNLY